MADRRGIRGRKKPKPLKQKTGRLVPVIKLNHALKQTGGFIPVSQPKLQGSQIEKRGNMVGMQFYSPSEGCRSIRETIKVFQSKPKVVPRLC